MVRDNIPRDILFVLSILPIVIYPTHTYASAPPEGIVGR
jgi:hypothetical protein